jgi:hypothetical protein
MTSRDGLNDSVFSTCVEFTNGAMLESLDIKRGWSGRADDDDDGEEMATGVANRQNKRQTSTKQGSRNAVLRRSTAAGPERAPLILLGTVKSDAPDQARW